MTPISRKTAFPFPRHHLLDVPPPPHQSQACRASHDQAQCNLTPSVHVLPFRSRASSLTAMMPPRIPQRINPPLPLRRHCHKRALSSHHPLRQPTIPYYPPAPPGRPTPLPDRHLHPTSSSPATRSKHLYPPCQAASWTVISYPVRRICGRPCSVDQTII